MDQKNPTPKRQALLQQIWDSESETYSLTALYDSLPHQYGKNILYQAEGLIISFVGTQPGITVTELASLLHKTPSACSQMVKKLRNKGWIEQERIESDNRLYALTLTESGMEVFRCHDAFNRECQNRTYEKLDSFTGKELQCFLKVRKKINEAYADDVKRSQQLSQAMQK